VASLISTRRRMGQVRDQDRIAHLRRLLIAT